MARDAVKSDGTTVRIGNLYLASELCEIVSAAALAITVVFLRSHWVAGVVLAGLSLEFAIALGFWGGLIQSRTSAVGCPEGPRHFAGLRAAGAEGEHRGGSSAEEGTEGLDESGGRLPAASGRG
jgi:hypothetical protein